MSKPTWKERALASLDSALEDVTGGPASFSMSYYIACSLFPDGFPRDTGAFFEYKGHTFEFHYFGRNHFVFVTVDPIPLDPVTREEMYDNDRPDEFTWRRMTDG